MTKLLATAKITPEGKTEVKFDGMIKRSEYAEQLRNDYENGKLFNTVSEFEKAQLVKKYEEAADYFQDRFELKKWAKDYVKTSAGLGDKSFFPMNYLDFKSFEVNWQNKSGLFKDARHAGLTLELSQHYLDKIVRESDEEFYETIQKLLKTKDVALFIVETEELNAKYIDLLYGKYADYINEAESYIQHCLAKHALAHYEKNKKLFQPSLKHLEDMLFDYDKETGKLKYSFFFHPPARRKVVEVENELQLFMLHNID